MRLIDADSVDIKKWFVVPADIQRIQAMLDETETVSGITLRELLESTQDDTNCDVWLGKSSGDGDNNVYGRAKRLLQRTVHDFERVLQYRVCNVTVDGDVLVIDLEGE